MFLWLMKIKNILYETKSYYTICFYSDFIGWKELEMIIDMITGKSVQERQLKQIAKSITNLVRQYNIQEGVSKKDDCLPIRFFREALGDGKSIGSEEEFRKMIDEYYKARGWDPAGNPPPLQVQ